MNTILKYTTLAMIGATFMTSCSDVPEDERYIYYPLPPAAKNVLISEFSGIRCTNCPEGAQVIHDILETYPENVIAVSMHPRGETLTNPIQGFNITSKEAAIYYAYYGKPALPSACFDGGEASGNRLIWTSMVEEQMKNEAPGEIYLRTSFDESSRELTVTYSADFNKEVNEPVNMILWIIEDGITGPQLSGSTTLTDYVHNHILRAAIGEAWGEELADSYAIDDTVSSTVTYTMPEEWVAANSKVVAVLINRGNKSVLQASQVNLTDGDNFPAEEDEE